MMAETEKPDWLVRLIDERLELEDRRAKLLRFRGTATFDGLDSRKRFWMERQLEAMTAYRDALAERISMEELEQAPEVDQAEQAPIGERPHEGLMVEGALDRRADVAKHPDE